MRGWRNLGWETRTLLAPDDVASTAAFITLICTNTVGLESNLTIAVVLDRTPPRFADPGVFLSPATPWAPLLPAERMWYSNSTTPELLVDLSRVIDDESPITWVKVEVVDVRASLSAGGHAAMVTHELDAHAGASCARA